ncbi:MAG: thioredoxin family protein [Bryobacteraceae bacterium]
MAYRLPLLTAVLAFPALVTAQSKASIDWKNYSDDVLKGAKNQGKPLLIEVWGEWCPPCRQMDRDVWSDQRVAALSRKFVCVSVKIGPLSSTLNTQSMFGSHGLYKINGYPAIVVMDPCVRCWS